MEFFVTQNIHDSNIASFPSFRLVGGLAENVRLYDYPTCSIILMIKRQAVARDSPSRKLQATVYVASATSCRSRHTATLCRPLVACRLSPNPALDGNRKSWIKKIAKKIYDFF